MEPNTEKVRAEGLPTRALTAHGASVRIRLGLYPEFPRSQILAGQLLLWHKIKGAAKVTRGYLLSTVWIAVYFFICIPEFVEFKA